MTASHSVAPTRAHLDELRRSFAGDIVRPQASDYDDARRVWNAMFDRQPALVVRPSNVDDVIAAVRYINELSEAGPEVTRASYGDAKLERLRSLKRAWDPSNVFHLNHNIAP